MSPGLIIYLIIGLIWVKMEDDLFDLDFSECSGPEIVVSLTMQLVHYLRILVAWPFYAAEDFLIWVNNSICEEK